MTAFSSKCFGESLHYIEGAFDAFAVLWTGVSIRPLHTKPVNLNKWAIISLKSGIFYTFECFFSLQGPILMTLICLGGGLKVF